MDVGTAITKALEILEQEALRPTVQYREEPGDWSTELLRLTTTLQQPKAQNPLLLLYAQRQQSPRFVHENPGKYIFVSSNYNLLAALYSQIRSDEHGTFIDGILKIIPLGLSRTPLVDVIFPAYAGHTSAFPLVAEFCVRTGHTDQLFASLASPKRLTVSLAILLMQLEDMIALNFNIFSDEELSQLTTFLTHIVYLADDIAPVKTSASRTNGPKPVPPPGSLRLAREIQRRYRSIEEECKQARYWYLKNELQQAQNLEINQDRNTVISFLERLGFSDTMSKALDAAESRFKAAATPFDLKDCMGLLRSFLEQLHREAAMAIATTRGESIKDTWGSATRFLQSNGFLTKSEEAFITSLYTLASDESVHPLIAAREYARLFRNVVMEYGVLFLITIDKKGVSLKPILAQTTTGTQP